EVSLKAEEQRFLRDFVILPQVTLEALNSVSKEVLEEAALAYEQFMFTRLRPCHAFLSATRMRALVADAYSIPIATLMSRREVKRQRNRYPDKVWTTPPYKRRKFHY
ncbi:MAG: hypothetical protein NT094_01685, partial [Candidatus Staskawiczbacteria bacterium]|nr:hypothetical protein [Candidatus Staskawiczbacteria bacterium]